MINSIKVERNVSLRKLTWIHRGGGVNNYYTPITIDELIEVGKSLYNSKKSFLTIGHTSNIYFKDSFSIDSVIDTKQLTSYKIIDDDTLMCECGVHMNSLSQYCVNSGFIGFEGMINLPGTIGGAIVNNSGCYNCCIDKVLKSVDILSPEGQIVNISSKDLGFTFRNSNFKTGKIQGVILRAYLDISNKGNVETLKRIAAQNTLNRRETQDPPAYNLGTTVNCFNYKRNFNNAIIRIAIKIFRIVIKDANKRSRVLKKLILFIYGRRYLDKYISDKRLSCFLWKDPNADLYFDEYLRLIDDIYTIFG